MLLRPLLQEAAVKVIEGGHELRHGEQRASLPPGGVPVRQERVLRHPPGRVLRRCAAIEHWGRVRPSVKGRRVSLRRRPAELRHDGRIVADETRDSEDEVFHGCLTVRYDWVRGTGAYAQV